MKTINTDDNNTILADKTSSNYTSINDHPISIIDRSAYQITMIENEQKELETTTQLIDSLASQAVSILFYMEENNRTDIKNINDSISEVKLQEIHTNQRLDDDSDRFKTVNDKFDQVENKIHCLRLTIFLLGAIYLLTMISVFTTINYLIK